MEMGSADINPNQPRIGRRTVPEIPLASAMRGNIYLLEGLYLMFRHTVLVAVCVRAAKTLKTERHYVSLLPLGAACSVADKAVCFAPRKEEEMNSLPDQKSHELEAFLRGPSLRGLSSSGLGWKGALIEEHTTEAGDYPQTISEHHIICMSCGPRSTGEYANEKGVYIPYTKYPGRFTFMPAGVIPAVRPHSRNDFILCGIDPEFVKGVEDELDQAPEEKPRFQTEIQDVSLSHLVKLLAAEAAQGGPLGRLYADHLAHALVMKFLLATGKEKRNNRHAASPLPRHLLRRVIERMNNLDVDLDLQSLANETGYSRTHFMRMFHAATGETPHRYILQLRLTHAKNLLRERRTSLIDIAALCGFSSQAHMATAFRQLLGITPSEYRRTV